MDERKAYQKEYWGKYAKKNPRIYGCVTNKDYEDLKDRARINERSLWSQVWSESCAYREKQYLPSHAVESRLREVKVQIRGVANNINQIARQSNTFSKLLQNRRLIQNLQYLEKSLEDAVLDLTHTPNDT